MDMCLIKIGLDLGIFQRLVNNKTSLLLKDLALDTGADETLLARIMRGLVAVMVVDDDGVETYCPNKVTRAFTKTLAPSCFNYK